MEFSRETASEANAILACTDTEVRLKDRAYQGSVIVTRGQVIDGWRPPAIDALTIGDLESLLALGPEVVLLGTGSRQHLPRLELYADFTMPRGTNVALSPWDFLSVCLDDLSGRVRRRDPVRLVLASLADRTAAEPVATFDGVPSRFPEPFHHPPRTKKLTPKCRPRDFLSEARRNLVRNCLCHLEPNPTTRKQRGNRPRIQPVRERHKIIL